MNDPTAGSRAKRLAEELKDLWEKPTTTECLRLSADAETQQQAANLGTSEDESGRAAAGGSVEREVTGVKSGAKKMQPARRP